MQAFLPQNSPTVAALCVLFITVALGDFKLRTTYNKSLANGQEAIVHVQFQTVCSDIILTVYILNCLNSEKSKLRNTMKGMGTNLDNKNIDWSKLWDNSEVQPV